MSAAIGASRVVALGVGVAVDGMMTFIDSAADYKANRAIPGRCHTVLAASSSLALRFLAGCLAASPSFPGAFQAVSWRFPGGEQRSRQAPPPGKGAPGGAWTLAGVRCQGVLTAQLTPCIISGFQRQM
ncbi:MAG: hypothetical protein EPN70_23995 [Paraburkholderia sp.]|nr:MAG: hypothetical protein EPN70_23995 [Paraburkholderia sp.]TAM31624.1 MAG: hypothetical protein EPN59_04500 [Paraburkholderia sp.]